MVAALHLKLKVASFARTRVRSFGRYKKKFDSSKSELKRKAREIIQASGADSAEYFNEVVRRHTGVTFREQSEIWLRQLQNRKRKPIGQSYAATIQGALDKWILPTIGYLPEEVAA